jgi:hypothetical protein
MRRRLTAAVISPLPPLNVSICSFPTCLFALGSSSTGFPVFADGQPRNASIARDFTPGKLQTIPPFLSGTLRAVALGDPSVPIALTVRDRGGCPLAGKSLDASVEWLLRDGSRVDPSAVLGTGPDAFKYILREFPFAGAGVSRLSLDNAVFGGGRGRSDGVLPLFRGPLRAYASGDDPSGPNIEAARELVGALSGDYGSYLRLLAAPPNSSIPAGARPLLALSVEGVSPPRRALTIVHHDADAAAADAGTFELDDPRPPRAGNSPSREISSADVCAALDVVETPTFFRHSLAGERDAVEFLRRTQADLSGSTPGGSNFSTPFTVAAFNSFGQRVNPTPAGNPPEWVAMHVADAVGPFAYIAPPTTDAPDTLLRTTKPIPSIETLDTPAAEALARAGGAGLLLLGVGEATQFVQGYTAPLPLAFARFNASSARASFPGFRLYLGAATLSRYAFTMANPGVTLSWLEQYEGDSVLPWRNLTAADRIGLRDATPRTLRELPMFFGATAGCASQLSRAVAHETPVHELAWTPATLTSAASASRPSLSIISNSSRLPLPYALHVTATGAGGAALSDAAFSTSIFPSLDNALATFPAAVGIVSSKVKSSMTSAPYFERADLQDRKSVV